MRVSTAFYYETSTLALLAKQNDVYKTQSQIDTGRRIVTPSDDPLGATHALQTSQAVATSESFLSNMATAKNLLAGEDNVLTAVGQVLQDARLVTINGRDSSVSSQERSDFANYLSQLYDGLVGYANERDSQGNYVFSGFKGNTKPFDTSTNPATYQGDSGQRSIAIAESRNLPVSDSGQAVFGAGGPNDPFAAISTLITNLRNPALTGSAYDTALDTAFTKLTNALTTVESVNAQVATRFKELTNAESFQSNLKLQNTNELARTENVDLQQAAVLLKMQQMTLEASQQSFVKSSSLTLFNFM